MLNITASRLTLLSLFARRITLFLLRIVNGESDDEPDLASDSVGDRSDGGATAYSASSLGCNHQCLISQLFLGFRSYCCK